ILVACLFTLFGCESGGDQVPPDAVVEITPNARTWNITEDLDDDGNCIVYPNYYQDELMTVRVLDGEGRPIGGVEIMVSMALSGNTFSGFQWARLYEDKNGDFIPDDDELVSDQGDSLLFTTTDEYNGHKTLIVRVNLSCTHTSILHVVAEGAAGEATIDVSDRE